MRKRSVPPQNADGRPDQAGEPVVATCRCCNGEVTFPQYNLQSFPWRVTAVLWLLVMIMMASVPFLAKIVPPPQRTDIRWWMTGVVYHMSPPAAGEHHHLKEFLSKKVTELNELGINIVRVSNFFRSTSDGAVLDYMSLNPAYGSMADFLSSMELLKSNDIRMIIDVPLAYTSNTHHWFSEDTRNITRDNVYLWNKVPETIEDGHLNSFWSKNNIRQEYYRHVKDHPEWALMDYSSGSARQRMETVFYYWLQYGVSGFILLNCDKVLLNDQEEYYSENYVQCEHPEDVKLKKLAEVIRSFKVNLSKKPHNYSDPDDMNNILMGMDIDCVEDGIWNRLYESGVDLVINKHLALSSFDNNSPSFNPVHLHRQVRQTLSRVPRSYRHNWKICDESFHLDIRQDENTLKLVNMIHLLLPGTAFICDGQLPQKQSVKYTAAREHIRALISWKRTPAMSWGETALNEVVGNVFSFVRYASGKVYPRYIIIINFGDVAVRRNFTMSRRGLVVPDLAILRYFTCAPDSSHRPDPALRYTNNSPIYMNDTYLRPGCGLLAELKLKVFF